MGLGFEVTNDNGSVQVIDTAPLITLKDTFTVITSDIDKGYISYEYLYAYKPANGSALLTNSFLKKNVNGVLRSRIVGQGEIVRYNEGAAPLGGERFGLEVYDDKGELQFSSNQKPLKVLDVVYNNDIRTTETVVNGRRTYWSKNYGNLEVATIIMGQPTWAEAPYFMTIAPAKRGNVFAFEAVQEHRDDDAFNWGVIPNISWRFHALVIDVTGY